METMTQNAQAASAPVSSKGKAQSKGKQIAQSQATAVQPYVMPDKPSLEVGKGYEVQAYGQDWVNKKGETKQRKSFVVKVPAKPLGLTGDAASAKATELGKAIKPAVLGRVTAFAASEATIVRRYSETPGKRKRIQLTLEQVLVESTIAKLAREYGLTEEEVARRLNVKTKDSGTTVNV